MRMMGDLSSIAMMQESNKNPSFSDDSSFSAYSCSGSETNLGITQSDTADPVQYNNNDDDSSFSSAYSTSSSFSGSEQTAAQFVPCHFAALLDLVNNPCAGGSTMVLLFHQGLFHQDIEQPPQQQDDIIPESEKIDLLLKKNPVLAKINDKIKEPAANNAETIRVAVAQYKINHGPTVASSMQDQPLNTSVPVRGFSNAKKSQQQKIKQTVTLLDFFRLNSGVDAAIPAARVSSKRQVSSPSVSYNNKMSFAEGSKGAAVNAPPIPVSGRSRGSQEPPSIGLALVPIPVSGRAPRSQVPQPIGCGSTLAEEGQPHTLKGDALPHPLPRLPDGLPNTNKTPQTHVSSSTSAGCSHSAASPPSVVGSSSSAKSFRRSAAGSPLVSTAAAASSCSDSETQPLLVIESDLVYSNLETEPEPVTLSDLANIMCEVVVDIMQIPEIPASKTHTTIASVAATVPVLKQRTMKSVTKTAKKTAPNTTTIKAALLATTVRTLANRNAKKMANLSTRKVKQAAPMTTKATVVPKMTTCTTSKEASSPTKARIPASRTMKRADLIEGRVHPMTDVNTDTLMPKGTTPAGPLSGPLITVTTTKKRSDSYKLHSRSP